MKPSIAWRTVRAQLLSRGNDHDEARRVAQAAITLAERTDGLVDHGDACLSLATVLGAAGDAAGARAAAERAVNLYERKGAAALAEKARGILGEHELPPAPAPPEAPTRRARHRMRASDPRARSRVRSQSLERGRGEVRSPTSSSRVAGRSSVSIVLPANGQVLYSVALVWHSIEMLRPTNCARRVSDSRAMR